MGESGHSPALVGKHFIMNYYTILHDEPQSLYKFYKDDSVYSFGTEGEPLSPEPTVTGQSNINDKIASLGFKKCKVHLSVLDAQPTLGGGVLLMVKGTMTNDGTSRKFVQTFLLAQQPTGYYVRNDILRYLADESAKTTTSAVHTQAPEAVPTPVAEKPKEVAPAVEAKPAEPIEAAQQSAPAVPVPESAQEETKPQAEPELPKETPAPTPVAAVPAAAVEQPKETPAPTPVAATPAPAAAAPAASPAPAAAAAAGGKPSPAVKPARGGQAGRGKGKEDKTRTSAPAAAAPSAEAAAAAPAPKESAPADGSWAALAARKKDAPVTPLAPVARPALPKAAPKKAAPTATAPAATAAAVTTEDASASPVVPKEETTAAAAAPEQAASAVESEKPVSEPNSIYVSNLPFAAKRSQVVDAFKGFGKIASVSMQSDKGYAFIEYETVEAAHHAIKLATENPISMDGRVLRVEERKTKRGGSGGASGAGRKLLGSGRSDRGAGSDRAPRPPRPDGRERPATSSPRPNGSDRRDRGDRERRERRAPGTGSPAPGRGPAAGGAATSSSGGVPRRSAPASTTPAAGGATAGKRP